MNVMPNIVSRTLDGKADCIIAHAMGLLKSVVFVTRADGKMAWPDPDPASAFLRNHTDDLPLSMQSYETRLDENARKARQKAIKDLTWDHAQYIIVYCLRAYDERPIWVEERGERISGKGKIPERIISVLTNIDARKRAEEKIVYRAIFDELTGLWNQTRLREAVSYSLARTKQADQSAGFLRLRVSNLNEVNETYGFETGDRLLKAIAKRLRAELSLPDVVGRISGADFGICLSDCDEDALQPFAKDIISVLSDTLYPTIHGDVRAQISVSGMILSKSKNNCAIFTDEAFSQTALTLDQAPATFGEFVDYKVGAQETRSRHQASITQAKDILDALNERRITLAYQPIVNAKTRELHHYECLMRLSRDDGEIVSAFNFIKSAEQLDLVHLLDRRALELAADMMKKDPTIKLALNVSAGTVKNQDFADNYLAALKAIGPEIKNLTLELTETVALEDPAMANRFSVEARMLGLKFSIDDFGSGYTTFQNLMAIEADSIKIDGSFIQDLSIMPHKQTFVRMMVDLAQTFSVKTVAEFVDNRENADLLTRLGVDYLQGYLFGIPSAAPNFKKVE